MGLLDDLFDLVFPRKQYGTRTTTRLGVEVRSRAEERIADYFDSIGLRCGNGSVLTSGVFPCDFAMGLSTRPVCVGIDFDLSSPCFNPMCNQVVQNEIIIKPGGRATVLLKGPGGEFELPFAEAVFGGPAKRESRTYWIQREGAEDVLVPNVSRFGEKNKTTGEQGWEDVPSGSALEGLLLPQPPGKDYRLLKIVTQPATPNQLARLGNDRAPIVHPPPTTHSD